MCRFVCLCLICLWPLGAWAQGFSSFSGRNHPELDWQVAETAHFEIMYPARLAGIEGAAAPIAEASYAALSDNLGITFDDKIRIYLSDEDEIVNGFAVPIGTGFTNIWVHQNDLASVWTGREKWLRKVIAHELAHIFHFRATRSNLGFLGYLFSDPTPSFWTEGLAQYQTESWDAFRGDRWLRTAVLDDRLSYTDGRSAWNGRLLYAVGNSQMRFFAEQYGDTTLANLLAHRKKVLLGLGRVHDLDEAFEATTDASYRDFYDRWRRHVNIYYNTLAASLENPDSLGAEPLTLPGQYLYDVQVSPDTAYVAVLALTSLERPVRRLFVMHRATGEARIVAEGTIRAPVAWSPDGQRLAYTRLVRGQYGSLINDLFVVDRDGRHRERLTHSRRAAAPAFAPDGQRLAYVASEGGTANVFLRDLATGTERQLTHLDGDVQLTSLAWHPDGDAIALSRFAPDGTRDLALLDVATGTLTPITDGAHDDRLPVWAPDPAARRLAYTSLRDGVPNIFIRDLDADSTWRMTRLATGATAHSWLPPDSLHAEGLLAAILSHSKTEDHAYLLDAARRPQDAVPVEVPEAYAGWTAHRPPATLPSRIPPDPSLIQRRYRYRSWRNLTHVVSLAAPYIFAPDDWGVGGLTTWIEPLGKHRLLALGGLSIADVADRSFFTASYVNAQWVPTVAFNAYRAPTSSRLYGDDLLVEDILGGDVTALWPLDWTIRPYTRINMGVRLRYIRVQPLGLDDFDLGTSPLPFPTPGEQADVTVALTWRQQRPYRYNVVHPLDGLGVQFEATAAARVLASESQFLRGNLSVYSVLPTLGLHRLFLYGRAQAQTGEALPQDVLGFSRHDDPQILLPGFIPFNFGGAERVRGFRRYALGNRVLFGTAEYRVPFLPSLETEVLGIVSLGATSLAAFVDAGMVWSGADVDGAEQRVGVGVEAKNALRLGDVLEISHALGAAQPAEAFGDLDRYEVYYRIRAAVPF